MTQPKKWNCRIALLLLAISGPPALSAADELPEEPQGGTVRLADEPEVLATFAAMQQPSPSRTPSRTQPAPQPRTTTRRTTRSSQPSSLRLASVPKMFGDVQFNGAQIAFQIFGIDTGIPPTVILDVPLAGGARRLKIGENNSPLPEDRVLFLYNHFHNAVNVTNFAPGDPTFVDASHVDRYTFGFEKTYWDEMASIEVRMPLVSSFDFTSIGGDVTVNSGNTGNLAIISKYLLYAEDSWALGAGVAFDLPTGSDVTFQTETSSLTIQNDALHLLPYMGLVFTPNDVWFAQFFSQLDFAANGNEVTGSNLPANLQYTDQNLLYLDLMTGVWLHRDPDAPTVTGVAAITELHYTSTIQDTDVVAFDQRDLNDPGFISLGGALTNPFNRIDVLNLTAGLQVEFGNTTALRVAAVAPLSNNQDERFFDAELQVQVNRRY